MFSLRRLSLAALFLTCFGIFSWIKVSFLVGSATAGFSLSHCLSPLIGLVAGSVGSMLFFFARTVLHVCNISTVSSFVFACHLPTLCAALYISSIHTTQYTITFYKKLLLAIIPLLCIGIFCSNPATSAAWAYSLFWFIPLAALFIPHNNLFIHMLGSTFTAHAVGSIIWLMYAPSLTASVWLGLIPVVIVERLLFASGMFVGYCALQKLFTLSCANSYAKVFTISSRFTSKKV